MKTPIDAELERAQLWLQREFQRETHSLARENPPYLLDRCVRAVQAEAERGTRRAFWLPRLAWATAIIVISLLAIFIGAPDTKTNSPLAIQNHLALADAPAVVVKTRPLPVLQVPHRPSVSPPPPPTLDVPPLPVVRVASVRSVAAPPKPTADMPPLVVLNVPARPQPVLNFPPLPVVRVERNST